MELTTITNTDNWGKQASSLNENFQKIKVELLKVDNAVSKGKGLFRTVEALKATYPTPEEGWWALVGSSLPASVYIAQNKAWTATGGTNGNITVNAEKSREYGTTYNIK